MLARCEATNHLGFQGQDRPKPFGSGLMTATVRHLASAYIQRIQHISYDVSRGSLAKFSHVPPQSYVLAAWMREDSAADTSPLTHEILTVFDATGIPVINLRIYLALS